MFVRDERAYRGKCSPFLSLCTWSQESGEFKCPAGGSVMVGGKKVVLGAVPRPAGSEQVSGEKPAGLRENRLLLMCLDSWWPV